MAESERVQVLGSQSPTADQIILHLDMDCFFAACERIRNPELEGEPVVIGGGFDADPPRGAVATASYEAREYGVHSAQPMARALEHLPRRETAEDPTAGTGIYLRGDHEYYGEVSKAVMQVVEEYAETIRRISIDEAYLDVTEETTWTTASEFAQSLKSEVEAEVGVMASTGIAPTMSCAKIASDHDKPDGLTVVKPGEVRSFLSPLDIEAVHGVGPVSAEKFREAGVETAGDLAELSAQEVVTRFGSNATTLHDRVRGIDPREVTPVGEAKSISKETSFEATTDLDVKTGIIQNLAEQVNERARRKDARYRTIGIKVVETPFDLNTRERSLLGPIRDPDLVESVALTLLEEFADAEVRKLGVRVSNLDFFDGEQTRVSTWSEKSTSEESPAFPIRRLGQRRVTEYTQPNS